MKKFLLFYLSIVCLQNNLFAQTTTSAGTTNVQIGQSYIANSDIRVSPYVVLASDYHDDKIFFRLATGTKFVITDILTDNNHGTPGYVITVWNFQDPKNTAQINEKRDFYNNFLEDPAKKGSNEINLKSTVVKKQTDLDDTKQQLKQKKDELDKFNKDLSTTQALVANASSSLYTASLFFDVSKNSTLQTLIDKKVAPNPNVVDFVSKQSEETKNPVENRLSIPTDHPLIQAGLKLPLTNNANFEKIKSDFKLQTAKLNDLKNKIQSTIEDITNISNQLPQKEAELKKAKKDYNIYVSQNSNPDNSQNWKIKKTDVGDPADNISNDDNPAAVYDQLAYIDSWANKWQFYITSQDFLAKTSMIYPRSFKFTWGFLTLPLKMRFDNKLAGRFNFEQNLNFGLTLGIKQQLIRKNDVSWNYLGGISVVNVPLNNAILGSDSVKAAPATSATAISMSAGVMYQYDKFQFGTFLGLDFAGQSANNKFAYQGKPWLGFAIGISLFGEGKTTATPQTQNSN